MKEIKTPEYCFRIGAEAMQSKIVAYLAVEGHMDIAPEVLNITIPKFQEPEIMTLNNQAISDTERTPHKESIENTE